MMLELFYANDYDNKSLLPVFKDQTTKNAYFNNLPNKYVADVNFNKIGEPLIVKIPFEHIYWYNYGRIQMPISGEWFYFSVIDISVNEQGRSVIHYEMDYWLTFCEKNRVVFDRCLVHRRFARNSQEYKVMPKQPFAPVRMETSFIQSITTGYSILLSLSQIKIGGNYQKGLTYFCIPDVGCEEVEGFAISLFSNYFINSDIVGAWLCPFKVESYNLNGWSNANSTTGKTGYYTLSSMNFNGNNLMPYKGMSSISIGSFVTDEMTLSGVCDAYGNIIWTLPFKKYNATNYEMYIHMSAQTCQVEVLFGGAPIDKIKNSSFTFACPTIDVVLNNWSDYCARTRDYEMQSRKLQNEQALVGAITQAGAGAMTGALIGSAVPVIGTAVGAVAGAVSSVAVSGVQYAVNNTYSPKFQKIEDEQYKHSQDTLSLSGTSLLEYVRTNHCLYAFRLVADSYSINRMNEMITTYGWYVNESWDGENIITTFKNSGLSVGGLQMDSNIKGGVPEAWKGKLAERFSNGVIMRRVGTW